jgi:glycerophosphoryl diester phosphodiesterase
VGDFLTGKIENYNYSHIQSFGKLKHGEQIPMLTSALDAVIRNTDLEFVWLDIKTVSSIPIVTAIAKQYSAIAAELGRKIEIVIGISSDEAYNLFISSNAYIDCGSVCELSPDQLTAINSSYWGPSWTKGLQRSETDMLHSKGIKSLCWTIDDVKYMRKYLTEGDFDGFVSNYPSILAFEYYSQKVSK